MHALRALPHSRARTQSFEKGTEKRRYRAEKEPAWLQNIGGKALVDESAEGAKMDAMVNETQEEIEMIEEGTNGPRTKESLVGEGEADGKQGE